MLDRTRLLHGGSHRSELIALAVLFGLYAIIVILKAWVADDAYITFRTIDNFVRGHGLAWNPPERVQAYTHPLWLFVVSALHMITREFFYTSVCLCMVFSYGAVVCSVFGLARSIHAACLGVALLAVSRAFTDYSTSGLENPLMHFIVVLFLWNYFRGPKSFRTLVVLCLLGALGMLNRLDAVFLLGPPLAFACWEQRGRRALLALLIGFAPLLVWEVFSLLYYGLLVPNSAYAKLNTGIETSALVAQGLQYLLNSLRWDPFTLLAMLFGAAVPVLGRSRRGAAVSAGILVHLLFVVRVGGDFMSGRFVTAPLIAAVVLWMRSGLRSRWTWPVTAAVVVLTLVVPFYSPFVARDYGSAWHAPIDEHGIADERSVYIDTASLLGARGHAWWPQPSAAQEAGRLRAEWERDRFLFRLLGWGVVSADEAWPPVSRRRPSGEPYRPVVVRGAVGFLAFYLGPEVYVLDYHALADAFLARLPAMVPDPVLAGVIPRLAANGWRIGHFVREVPRGYVETLAIGENRIRDPDLARLYARVALITRGDLLDGGRLRAIWELNTGVCDELVRRYLQARARPRGSARTAPVRTAEPG